MSDDEEQVRRVKVPKGDQTLGVLEKRLGGSRSEVRCMDGQTRICRIPGRLKRSLWVRQGDLVLVEPWEYGGDEKGDILHKYKNVEVRWLKDNGYLEGLDDTDEF